MRKHLRKRKVRGARDIRTFALLFLISFTISILAWSAMPGTDG